MSNGNGRQTTANWYDDTINGHTFGVVVAGQATCSTCGKTFAHFRARDGQVHRCPKPAVEAQE